jgi:hypothetical protein
MEINGEMRRLASEIRAQSRQWEEEGGPAQSRLATEPDSFHRLKRTDSVFHGRQLSTEFFLRPARRA